MFHINHFFSQVNTVAGRYYQEAPILTTALHTSHSKKNITHNKRSNVSVVYTEYDNLTPFKKITLMFFHTIHNK